MKSVKQLVNMQVMVQYFVLYNLKVTTVLCLTVGLGFTWIDAQILVHVFEFVSTIPVDLPTIVRRGRA